MWEVLKEETQTLTFDDMIGRRGKEPMLEQKKAGLDGDKKLGRS